MLIIKDASDVIEYDKGTRAVRYTTPILKQNATSIEK
tara:strand:+ start:399 stop:509 length:111 start_codon:yes stop_codon:yes gene_type:complete